jgi:hypothetical protein
MMTIINHAEEVDMLTYNPVQKMYMVRVKTEVEIIKENPGDALIEAGKKVAGTGCVVGGLGCMYKAVQEKNLGWAILGILLEIPGFLLIFS